VRDYGKVYSTFWSSTTTGSLSDDGKVLALYLMTCSHSTIAGVFRLPDGYVSEDLGWGPERVREGFTELFGKGFANRCETTKWVWITKHLTWNPPENPNQRKAAAKCAVQIPDECGWKLGFMRVCGPLLNLEAPENTNPCGTLAEPFLNQKQEQKQEQKKEPLPAKAAGDPEGFAEFWSSWPSTPRKQDRKKCAEKWKRSGFGQQLPAIVSHVEALKHSKSWREGFEPAPLTYLNGERWQDGAPVCATNGADIFAGAK